MINALKIAFTHINKTLIERAKSHFGLTTDFRKGAWLLPDGTMLNFGDEKGRLDHSDIKKIFPDEIKEQDPAKYIAENEFVRKKFLDTGSIRLVSEGGGVEIAKEPTEAQFSMIEKYFKWLSLKEFFIDLSGKGQTLSKSYDNTEEERARALVTIEKYFKGELRSRSEIQQYHYSNETRRYLKKCM
jgi:hypothetical protein